MIGYVLDDIFVQHRAPSGHPERPARAEAVRDALIAAGIHERGQRVTTRRASDEELARVHAGGYLDDLAKKVGERFFCVDFQSSFLEAFLLLQLMRKSL